MHRLCTTVLAAAGVVSLASAQPSLSPEQFHVDPDGTIHAGGEVYQTWDAYLDSDFFLENGLRCGTRPVADPDQIFNRAQSDCSFTLTVPDPSYDPSVVRFRIPVVVHIIQTTGGTGNIPDSRVFSQIDILNEDFLALAGTNGGSGTDVEIEFYLATTDPNGDPTNGITRSTNNTWYNDGGGYYNTLAWDTNRYLNIYTNSAGGALGYVPNLPQSGIAGSNTDRVVILHSAFGRNSPGGQYSQGRTATHEVGHYLGLFHMWDNGCGSASSCYSSGDLICDTNLQSSPNFSCNSGGTCGFTDDFRNYMDYTADLCMEHFTPDQALRMRCSLKSWRSLLYELTSPCGTDPDCDDGDPCNGVEFCDNGICRPGTIVDCNGNGIDDACDISGGFEEDCNNNGVPDSCDIAAGLLSDCNNNGLADACDISTGFDPDCNNNGIPDSCDLSPYTFAASSGQLSPIGFGASQSYTVFNAPDATADVTLDFLARGDFDFSTEKITITVGGTFIGTVYDVGSLCASGGEPATMTVPVATWNTAITSGAGDVLISMLPSSAVSAGECVGSFVEVSVSYPAPAFSEDVDQDGVPDECAPAGCSEADVTTTGAGAGDPGFGVPDGQITGADINYYVNAWVAQDLAIADLTTTGAGAGDPGFGVPDGQITGADINYYVNLWIAGCP